MADPLPQKCPESLRREIEASPQRRYDLILRVTEAGDEQQRQIEEAGFTVRRRLRLVPSFAVSGPGEGVLALVSHPWLISVEVDQEVQAFR